MERNEDLDAAAADKLLTSSRGRPGRGWPGPLPWSCDGVTSPALEEPGDKEKIDVGRPGLFFFSATTSGKQRVRIAVGIAGADRRGLRGLAELGGPSEPRTGRVARSNKRIGEKLARVTR